MAKTFNTEQCAEFLNIHRTTLSAIAGSGELRGALIGRRWVFLEDDVVAYLQKKVDAQVAGRLANTPEARFIVQKIAAAKIPAKANTANKPGRRRVMISPEPSHKV